MDPGAVGSSQPVGEYYVFCCHMLVPLWGMLETLCVLPGCSQSSDVLFMIQALGNDNQGQTSSMVQQAGGAAVDQEGPDKAQQAGGATVVGQEGPYTKLYVDNLKKSLQEMYGRKRKAWEKRIRQLEGQLEAKQTVGSVVAGGTVRGLPWVAEGCCGLIVVMGVAEGCWGLLRVARQPGGC